MRGLQSHRILKGLLLFIATIMAAAGLVAFFASGWVAWLVPASMHFAPAGFSVILLKAVGLVALTGAYLSYAASRDPVRYVAFVDALIFLLIAAAGLDLYGLFVLHVAPFYPALWVVLRSIVRLAVAAVLFTLRPRGE